MWPFVYSMAVCVSLRGSVIGCVCVWIVDFYAVFSLSHLVFYCCYIILNAAKDFHGRGSTVGDGFPLSFSTRAKHLCKWKYKCMGICVCGIVVIPFPLSTMWQEEKTVKQWLVKTRFVFCHSLVVGLFLLLLFFIFCLFDCDI